MSFLSKSKVHKSRKTSIGSMFRTPAIESTDVEYFVDMTKAGEGLPLSQVVEGDIYQFLYDREKREDCVSPEVVITVELPDLIQKHPDYWWFNNIEFTVDMTGDDFYIDESWAIIDLALKEHVIPYLQEQGIEQYAKRYVVTYRYTHQGASVDCYGRYPMLMQNMNYRTEYANLKRKIERGVI